MAEKKKKKDERTAKAARPAAKARPTRTAAEAPKAARPKAAPPTKAERPARAKGKPAPKRAVARPVTRVAARPAAEREESPAEPAAPKQKPTARPLPTAPAGHAPLIGSDGAATANVALPAALVDAKRRAGVLFQAVIAAAANARAGSASTLNRARVRGGGAKPWRQKGTGRARQGSIRAPHWRHGGVVFGPNGRRYDQRIPEKMRKEAFAEAFASLAGAGRVLVYEGVSFDGERPRTKAVLEWLDKIGDAGAVLFVTPDVDEGVARATANLRRVDVRSVGTVRTSDVLTHDTLLVRRDALEPLAARAHIGRGEASPMPRSGPIGGGA